MATGIGGMLHTFPFLIALKLAYPVVACELVAIAYIRYRFMNGSSTLSSRSSSAARLCL
jgi:hypothetical protein